MASDRKVLDAGKLARHPGPLDFGGLRRERDRFVAPTGVQGHCVVAKPAVEDQAIEVGGSERVAFLVECDGQRRGGSDQRQAVVAVRAVDGQHPVFKGRAAGRGQIDGERGHILGEQAATDLLVVFPE